jgi:hypothetical protein
MKSFCPHPQFARPPIVSQTTQGFVRGRPPGLPVASCSCVAGLPACTARRNVIDTNLPIPVFYPHGCTHATENPGANPVLYHNNCRQLVAGLQIQCGSRRYPVTIRSHPTTVQRVANGICTHAASLAYPSRIERGRRTVNNHAGLQKPLIPTSTKADSVARSQTPDVSGYLPALETTI